MNVIIRLKNLPWTANAMDIRSFFKGLSIPEGGVHIVGGENGDAFIAFSTDEDARQAMAMSGGKLKEIQVTLLLSSRAEMQKVIEKARQTSMNLFQLTTPAAPAQVVEPKMSKIFNGNMKINQTEVSSQLPQIPQPPIISLTSFLAQTMQQKPPPQSVGLNSFNTYKSQIGNSTEIPGLGFTTNSDPNQFMESAAYSALFNNSHDLNKTQFDCGQIAYGTKKEPMNVVPMYSTSCKQNSFYETSNRRDRSRSREKSKNNIRSRRSRSRSKDIYKSRDRSPDKRSRSNSRELRRQKRSRFSDVDTKPSVQDQPVTPFYPTTNTSQAVFSSNNSRPSNSSQPNVRTTAVPIKILNVWDKPPPTYNGLASQTIEYGSDRADMSHNYNTEISKLQQLDGKRNPSAFQSNYDMGCCVKLSNVHSDTFYGDLRRHFLNLHIGQNDIKLINDSTGDRTDIVLIRFISSEFKKFAMQKNGHVLNGNNLTITHISEDEFELAVDRFKPIKSEKRNDLREDKDPRSKPYERERNGNNRSNGFEIKRLQDESPKMQPSENYTTLIIDDLPKSAYEEDIRKIFPRVQQVLLDRYEAYIKFDNHEDAEEALKDRYKHYINNKRVFLDPCAEQKFDDICRKLKKTRRRKSVESIDEDSSNNEPEILEIKDDEEINELPIGNTQMARRDPRKPPVESYSNCEIRPQPSPAASIGSDSNGSQNLDPRRINMDPRSMKSDCLVMKNLELKTSDTDVVEFFRSEDVIPTRVHILLDRVGRPCGDSFCEFATINDATRALIKNNQFLGKNRVDIRYIPRNQVERVLHSFGPQQRNGNFNAQSSFYPENFGSPGCVLALSNVCYKASTEDILSEFWDFNLKPNQVLRRFNEFQRPTGNACLAFNSPTDAKRALNTKHLCKILGRTVYLKPL